MSDDHAKNEHDKNKRPHGETGDTVRQAAEVSTPTSTVGRVLDTGTNPVRPGPDTGSGAGPARPDSGA
jgi:hypothetical protein